MNGVTKNRLKKWAILFIVWGWLMLFGSLMGYVERRITYSFLLEDIMHILQIALPVIAIAFTFYFLVEQRRDKRGKQLRISLISLWIALVVSMVIVNLIQQNVIHEINFELQHPLFMTLTAFAITATALILRYRFMIIGGVLFGLCALAASYLKLPEQLLVESLAWLIAFIIPGHLLYARNKKINRPNERKSV
ncbi:MAG: hypothetical protein GX042_09415 [Bacteroidales bacterium]|jgi:uncharacterized Tic20 family protein|nr:hypothetical protein [Bacteroidales bacterium]